MDKFPTNSEGEKNKYDSLKEVLFDGSASLEETIDQLMEWDQSTLSRDASDGNLKFLHDPQIVEYISQYPEVHERYHGFLSFTEFHVAQRLAANNSAEATDHFRKALESARVDQSDTNSSWAAYVEGSLLYMQDKEIPEELIAKVGSSRNAQILRNFNAGLKERGTSSYMEDYRK